MSSKPRKTKTDPQQTEAPAETNDDSIPKWAMQQIRPEDDPFHDDFEVEIVPK